MSFILRKGIGGGVSTLLLLASAGGLRAADAQARVDTAAVLRTAIPGEILGGNMAVWVAASRLDADLEGYVRDLGSGVMRFPGGNLSNNYCWVTIRAAGNDHQVWDDWSWGTNVDQFLDFAERAELTVLYSVNPFDHTVEGVRHGAVEEAVALVRRLAERGLSGALYEVGNENDGFWNRTLTPDEYADRFVALAGAMKAEDPSISMLGPVGSGYTPEWIDGFVDRLAARDRIGLLDYLSYHVYGGWIAGDNQNRIDLAQPQRLGPEIAAIRTRLDLAGGVLTRIAITEYNAAIWAEGIDRDQFSVRQALWLADFQGELFRHVDLANVWITLHPGRDPHSLIDDQAAVPTPTRNYWAAHLVHRTLSGATPREPVSVLATASSLPTSQLSVHAVAKADGGLGVLLVNKTPEALSLSLGIDGAPPCRTASALVLDEPAYLSGAGPYGADAGCSPEGVLLSLPGQAVAGVNVPLAP
jgi:hypothetical protein